MSGHDPAVPPRCASAPPTPVAPEAMAETHACDPVSVVVLSEDRLTYEGAVAALSEYPGIRMLPWENHRSAQVLVAFSDDLSNRVLTVMGQVAESQPDIQVVLVAESVSEPRLMRAIGFGVVSVLLRERITFAHIGNAVAAVRKGHSDVPPELLRHLIRHIRRVDRTRTGDGYGLKPREITVLSMLSDGLDTAQIARRLNYSERTIKSIVHGIVIHLGVSNRTHAVAHVIRAGLL
ncbi:response regulator transcription factor [Streptomyces sp. NPDC026673]|uniref:helix-turn-helix transcriptional regulator n=1 Tax=Streptomyces sp. NPDC026673 TaxID=3155724 RepID=UPI0033E3397A